MKKTLLLILLLLPFANSRADEGRAWNTTITTDNQKISKYLSEIPQQIAMLKHQGLLDNKSEGQLNTVLQVLNTMNQKGQIECIDLFSATAAASGEGGISGLFDPSKKILELNDKYCQRYYDTVAGILIHEGTHAWHWQHFMPLRPEISNALWGAEMTKEQHNVFIQKFRSLQARFTAFTELGAYKVERTFLHLPCEGTTERDREEASMVHDVMPAYGLTAVKLIGYGVAPFRYSHGLLYTPIRPHNQPNDPANYEISWSPIGRESPWEDFPQFP